jgi:hypothetical protein
MHSVFNTQAENKMQCIFSKDYIRRSLDEKLTYLLHFIQYKFTKYKNALNVFNEIFCNKGPNIHGTFVALRMGAVKIIIIWDVTLPDNVVNEVLVFQG